MPLEFPDLRPNSLPALISRQLEQSLRSGGRDFGKFRIRWYRSRASNLLQALHQELRLSGDRGAGLNSPGSFLSPQRVQAFMASSGDRVIARAFAQDVVRQRHEMPAPFVVRGEEGR